MSAFPPAQRSLLLTASAASCLIMFDSNLVAVALPSIARSLNAGFHEIQWVISAYVLTFAALLMAAGSLADLWGRKRATLTGLGLFLLASALCGAAPTATTLDLARAFQGVAASILLTSALAVINQAFTGPDRGRAYAVWGTCMGIAIVSGPILGGGIVEAFGWRAAFLINIPICAFLLLRTAQVVEESRDEDAQAPDWAGIGTFTLALLLLTWSFIDGNAKGWSSPSILARLFAAAILFVAFVLVEIRQRRPMIDLTLFRQRRFVGSSCAMLGYAGAAQVMIFFLPSFLQRAYGLGATWAGLAMLPFALPMFAMPQVAARLARRFSARIVLTFGLSVTLAGDLLMSMLALHQVSYAAFALAMLATGVGAGLLNGETAKVIQDAAPKQRSGMASGISATVRFTGLLLVVAGLGAASESVGSATFIARLRLSGLDEETIGHLVIRAMVDAPSEALRSLPLPLQSEFQVAVHHSIASALMAVGLGAAVIGTIAAVLTMVLVTDDSTTRAVATTRVVQS